jgi:hypothetical protein
VGSLAPAGEDTTVKYGLPDRFIAAPDENGCERWRGHIDKDGYGKSGRYYAHRLTYAFTHEQSQRQAPAMTEESEIDILKKHVCCHSDEEVARILAEFRQAAVKEEGERIAQAIETDPGLRLGHNVSVVCSCLRCEVANGAARIAREVTR